MSCIIIVVFRLCTKAHSIHVTCAHWKGRSSCFVEVSLLEALSTIRVSWQVGKKWRWQTFQVADFRLVPVQVGDPSRFSSHLAREQMPKRPSKSQKTRNFRKTEQNSVKARDNMIPRLMIYDIWPMFIQSCPWMHLALAFICFEFWNLWQRLED